MQDINLTDLKPFGAGQAWPTFNKDIVSEGGGPTMLGHGVGGAINSTIVKLGILNRSRGMGSFTRAPRPGAWVFSSLARAPWPGA